MRLEADVLRDVLLHIEKNLIIEIDITRGGITSDTINPLEIYEDKLFEKCDRAMILYAVRMLSDAGLINSCVKVGATGDWQFGSGLNELIMALYPSYVNVLQMTINLFSPLPTV